MEFFFFVLLACVVPEAAKGENRVPRILVNDQFTALANKVEQQQKELDQLKAAVGSSNKVAFKAILSKPLTPLPNQLIEFDDVRFNVGQAYHHGTFVAPYTGTYLFSVQTCSIGSRYILLDLLRNGNMISTVLAGDDSFSACASTTTITALSAGDDVTVKHHGTSGDYINVADGHQTSFIGVLLY